MVLPVAAAGLAELGHCLPALDQVALQHSMRGVRGLLTAGELDTLASNHVLQSVMPMVAAALCHQGQAAGWQLSSSQQVSRARLREAVRGATEQVLPHPRHRCLSLRLSLK